MDRLNARIADVMCPPHREQGQSIWPGDVNEGGQALTPDCSACDGLWSIASGGRSGARIRCLPDLSGSQWVSMTATHEAAHALLGIEAGITPRRAWVSLDHWDRPRDGQPSGQVQWLVTSSLLLPDRYATMVWAGQEASLLWLERQGLGTESNFLDARALGAGDIDGLRRSLTPKGLPVELGASAARVAVREHWGRIQVLAQELAAHGELSGDQIIQIANAGPVPA